MSRILPIQPPIIFRQPHIWTKEQQDDLIRMWQDMATYLNRFVGPLSRGSEDITAGVVSNVEIVQFGPDQGIIAVFVSGDTMVVSIHCSFKVNVAPVDFIQLTLPMAPSVFADFTVDIGTGFVYEFNAPGLKPGAMYQGSGDALNSILLYSNDFSPWPVSTANIYAAGQIVLPLAGAGV